MKINSSNLRIYIFAIITGLILSSCSKKDSTPADNLIGTWTAGTTTFTATVGTRTLEQYFTEVMGYTADQTLVLTTLYNAQIQQSFAGTMQVSANNTYTSNFGGIADSGTWSLSADGKKLTIDSNTDIPITVDVLELTATKLQLKIPEVVSQDLNSDGTDEIVNLIVTVNFTK